ncbi:MAG TPA: LON peptidase substrate-binding domain-containing protein [Fimbriimonadaceae bacterium]|nr:LON peptidase substrate-binding domain-containing protein [Fimbriimonadaceae bacterium]HRJ33338.1 LON peptidase substrate-binding domain-containing protein [Fimbriimonadaceae bacterium]
MPHSLEEIPLFPLPIVVFPYANLQLHIFEARYRQMVDRCLEFDSPFGIVMVKETGPDGLEPDPCLVGTAVRITHVQHFDDGTMNIHIHGERRFRIRKFAEDTDPLVGMVEPVFELDYEDSPHMDALVMRAQESFKLYIEMVFSRSDFNVQIHFPQDATALSFQIAEHLPLDNPAKQRFLELTDTLERLQDLIPLIERQIIEAKSPIRYRVTRHHFDDWIHPN